MMIQLEAAPVTGSMREGKKKTHTMSLELFITFHCGFIKKKPELLCWLHSKPTFLSPGFLVLMRSDRGDEADFLHGAGSRFALPGMRDDYRRLQKLVSR